MRIAIPLPLVLMWSVACGGELSTDGDGVVLDGGTAQSPVDAGQDERAIATEAGGVRDSSRPPPDADAPPDASLPDGAILMTSLRASDLVADGSTIVFTVAQGSHDGAIYQCPRASCAPNPAVLASGTWGQEIGRIAMDSAGLFTSTYDPSGFVVGFARGGGLQLFTASESWCIDVALDGTTVFWTGFNTIFSSSRTGGASTLLVTSKQIGGMEVDASEIFWSAADSDYNPSSIVHALAKSGVGSSRDVGALPDDDIGDIVLDATNVYFAGRAGGAIGKIPKSGGATTILAQAAMAWPTIAVDAAFIYWHNANTGEIAKTPIAGGPTVVLAHGSLMYGGPIAVDDAYVFWSDFDGIKRIPK